MNNGIDVSAFPFFKEQTLKVVDELQLIYDNDQFSAGAKATHFERILKKYDCL